MKNVIIAVVLFSAVLASVVAIDAVEMRKTETLVDDIRSMIDSEAYEELGEAKEKWNSLREGLFFVINHQDIDSCDLAFEELDALLDGGDDAEIKRTAQRLCFLLDDLLDTEKVSLANIF